MRYLTVLPCVTVELFRFWVTATGVWTMELRMHPAKLNWIEEPHASGFGVNYLVESLEHSLPNGHPPYIGWVAAFHRRTDQLHVTFGRVFQPSDELLTLGDACAETFREWLSTAFNAPEPMTGGGQLPPLSEEAAAGMSQRPPVPGVDGADWDDTFDWFRAAPRAWCIGGLPELATKIGMAYGTVKNKHSEYQKQNG